ATPLAEVGFKRSGRTWRRQLGDDAIQVIDVQWRPESSGVEGSFSLSAGVYFPALAEIIAEFPVTRSPKEYDCHVRRHAMPNVPSGWRVRVPGAAQPDPDLPGALGNFFSWLDRRADRKAPAQH